jgi:hypothetical protein
LIEGGAVSKTAYVAEGAYTFEITGTYGYRVCCQYGAGEFKITMNDEPVAINSSGEFQNFVRKTLLTWSGAVLAPDVQL